MRKILAAISATVALLSADIPTEPVINMNVDINAEAAVIYQPDTEEVLYEKEADSKLPIASITKIMTCVVVAENCSMDEIVEIIPEYLKTEGSSMELKAGDRYTIKELLYGLLLCSGNDAAVALACHTSGNEGEFVKLMNEKAGELGCKNTCFANPHGLDAENHYSTALDMAKIMSYAMENKIFAEISGTKTYSLTGKTLTNHNKLLWSCDGVISGKTGYTSTAGRTLVSCCERDGMRLICVTLNDKNDWNDHSALYDSAYENYMLCSFPDELYVPVISGERENAVVVPRIKAVLIEKVPDLSVQVCLPKFEYAPITEGDIAGSLELLHDGVVIGRYDLYYTETIDIAENARLNFWEKLKWAWYFYMKNSAGYPIFR